LIWDIIVDASQSARSETVTSKLPQCRAAVKLKRDKDGGRRNFEILTGRIERTRGRGRAFAIVRDLDKRAKQKVQAVLRLAGRTSETSITVLTDGEDGLRGVVGWFGRKCEHRLDWFHISRRLDRIGKQLLYLPSSPIYGRRLAFHSKNLYRIRWELWNSGIAIADHAMKIFRAGLAEDAWDSPEHLRLFQDVEKQLDELRSYLYANESSVGDYAKTFRSGERVSTAHVESTVNQLVNWRFCKKQQMTWTRAGAQGLLHVKTAVLNGMLGTYTKCPVLVQTAFEGRIPQWPSRARIGIRCLQVAGSRMKSLCSVFAGTWNTSCPIVISYE
jgi:hypothetical protein